MKETSPKKNNLIAILYLAGLGGMLLIIALVHISRHNPALEASKKKV